MLVFNIRIPDSKTIFTQILEVSLSKWKMIFWELFCLTFSHYDCDLKDGFGGFPNDMALNLLWKVSLRNNKRSDFEKQTNID